MGEDVPQISHYSEGYPQRMESTEVWRRALVAYHPLTPQVRSPVGHKGVSKQ